MGCNDKRRTVEFALYEWNVRRCRNEEVDRGIGTFHGWGLEYEQFDNGVGNYSVGIVETEDGNIVTVLPRDIKFIEKKEDENV